MSAQVDAHQAAATEFVPLTFDESRRRVAESGQFLAGGVGSNFRLGIAPTPLMFDRADGPLSVRRRWQPTDRLLSRHGPDDPGPHPARRAPRRRHPARPWPALRRPERGRGRGRPPGLRNGPLRRTGALQLVGLGGGADGAAPRPAPAPARRVIVKFDGHYHGWFDNILWSTAPEAGANAPVAGSRGQLAEAGAEVVALPWNDLPALEARLARGDVAGVIMEASMCKRRCHHAPPRLSRRGPRRLQPRPGPCWCSTRSSPASGSAPAACRSCSA